MENSQTAKFANDISATQVLTPVLSGDYLWKSLYSHSYTLFFNCEKCNREFDIDGWFYKFDTLECPVCGTEFTGVFGKILPGTSIDHERSRKSVLKLESFDGQEIEIHLSSTVSIIEAKQDHIVLVIFSKSNDRRSKPWCLVDWSVKNAKAQYLMPQSTTAPINREKHTEKKIKSVVPIILFGLVTVIGLCSFLLIMTL